MPGRLAALALAALVVAAGAGCGDDDDEPDADAAPYVDALVVSLTTQQPGELFWSFTDEEATCIAERTVDSVGADFFVDNGITTSELEAVAGIEELGVALDEEQAQEAAEAYSSCDISYGRYFTGGTASETAMQCIDETVDVEAVVAGAAARLQGNEVEAQEVAGGLASAVGTCLAAG